MKALAEAQFNAVSRLSVSFACFWDVNITAYWRLKSEPVIGWKFRAVFIGLLPFKTEIQSFSSKSGQKCNLLYRLKDKGKRYSTLETMLSKRQGKTRIKMCFHLFSTVCFCRGVVVRALITQSCFWKSMNEQVVEFALFYLFCRLLELKKNYIKMLLWVYLCKAPIYGVKSPYFVDFSAKQRFDSSYKHSCSTLDKL